MQKKERARSRALNILAAIFFVLSVSLFIVHRLIGIDSVAMWYSKYTGVLMEFENRVESLDDTWLVVLVIEANFFLKAVIPWIPISCICVMSGVVFKWPAALAINIIGLTVLYTVKYFWGKHLGGGNTEKILAKYEKIYTFIDTNKFGSPILLFFFRLIPCLPLNSVSQVYGSLEFDYWKFLVISLLGSSYKLFSYTIIGRNVYDPLSGKFLLPLAFLFLFSSFTIFAVNSAINVTGASIRHFRRVRKKSKSENSGGTDT
ncbi:MAG: VTT domain-containing protein [Clostridia bacterium]|nr:VTT domain-containing protein [Clostridia bacterium]